MLKKIFRDTYLIGISFIAGILFIIQCGGQSSTLAEVAQEIGAALGISYDNSNSSLNAATVQAALDELEKRFPVVLDKNKKVIGHMLDTSSDGLRIWAYDIQAALEVDPLTGEFIDEKRDALYFSDNNCSGKNYLEENNPGDP